MATVYPAVRLGANVAANLYTRLVPGDDYYLVTPYARTYDVQPDGERFVVLQAGPTVDRPVSPPLVFVQHWSAEVDARAGN